MTAAAALALVALLLYTGRRDLTRPAVAFGVVWFGLVALAQLRLTDVETEWPGGFTALVFVSGIAFVLAATLAGGTAPARGSFTLRRDEYQARRLVVVALVLLAGGVVGMIYKAGVLGGVPLLSGKADELRANAYGGGDIAIPAWSTALTDGFFLALWCALAAIWVLRGRATRAQLAALWLLAGASLFGVALLASRNTVLLAALIPFAAVYLVARPRRRLAGLAFVALGAGVVVLIFGGLFVARVGEQTAGNDTFLDKELERQPAALRPVVPFYINGVYPFEAANRLYQAVPDREPYALGGNSLTSLPDAAFPDGKPAFGSGLADLMDDAPTPDAAGGGFAWSVGTYLARLFGDLGWPGALLGSLLLGLGFGGLFRWARGGSGFLPVGLAGFLAYYSAFMSYDNLLSFSVIAAFDLAAIGAIDLFVRGRLDERAQTLVGRLTAPAPVERLVSRVEARPAPFLAALLVLAGLIWIYAGRGGSFVGDEWDMLHGRRTGGLDPYLRPHNEHPVIALLAYYKVMWSTVGIQDYWPYVVANVLVHLTAVVLVFEMFRRRAGVVAAFAAATILAFYGNSYGDVLWDFEMAWLAAVVMGAAAFMLVQRPGAGRALLAIVLLVGAEAWGVWGVVFALAIGVQLVLQRDWRRLAVPMVPLALYAVWFQQRAAGRTELAQLGEVPRFVADAFAVTLANLAGLPISWGRVLAVVAVVALAAWLLRVRRPAPVQVAALSLPLIGWLMTAAGRAGLESPTQARFAWPFGVLVLIAAAHVIPPLRLDRRALLVVAVLIAGAVVSNLSTLRTATADARAESDIRLAKLGALDLAREGVAPNHGLDPLAWYGHFRADTYFAATDAYGSPGYSEERLLSLPAETRTQADLVLLTATPPRLRVGVPVGGAAPRIPGTAPLSPRCARAAGPPLDMQLPASGVVVAPAAGQEVRVRYRLFGPTYFPEQPQVISARTAIVPLRSKARTPWTVRLESDAPFRLCGAPG